MFFLRVEKMTIEDKMKILSVHDLKKHCKYKCLIQKGNKEELINSLKQYKKDPFSYQVLNRTTNCQIRKMCEERSIKPTRSKQENVRKIVISSKPTIKPMNKNNNARINIKNYYDKLVISQIEINFCGIIKNEKDIKSKVLVLVREIMVEEMGSGIYHYALYLDGFVYDFNAKSLGGLRKITASEFIKESKSTIYCINQKDGYIQPFKDSRMKMKLCSVECIREKINLIFNDYKNGKLKYSLMDMNCESIVLFLISEEIKDLYSNHPRRMNDQIEKYSSYQVFRKFIQELKNKFTIDIKLSNVFVLIIVLSILFFILSKRLDPSFVKLKTILEGTLHYVYDIDEDMNKELSSLIQEKDQEKLKLILELPNFYITFANIFNLLTQSE